ncbi:MAG: hypothetical protein H0U53_01375, partial [Actinobacteria bacterium]|nr:hypothetical protein [Actinomycetota bacterium]
PPFSAGDPITTTLDGYKATTDVVIPQFNPLLNYVENFPAFPFGPPPYAEILQFAATTDANGDKTTNVNMANPFDGTNNSSPVYDSNIACPVNATTANYLGNSDSISLDKPAYSGHCMVANGQYGTGTLERAIDMTSDPTPAAPTVSLDDTTVSRTQVINITGGSNWNANPFFGSSKLFTNPGQTEVNVKICNSATGICSATVGNATVAMTRYIHNGTSFVFSGATLSGTITVGTDVPSPCTTCYVRVKQLRPTGGHITHDVTITVS